MTAVDELAAKLGPVRYADWKWLVSGTPSEHHERHAEVLLDVIADRPVRVTADEVAMGIRFPRHQIVGRDEVAPFLPPNPKVDLSRTNAVTRLSDRRLIDELLRSVESMRKDAS